MKIVCNTSPLTNLAAINKLMLIREVYGRITIPNAVANEIAKVGTIYPQAGSIPSQDWITVCPVTNWRKVQHLQGQNLDSGEAEAIALALELDAELLIIDEQLGRKIALTEGLNITGLLGVLLEAKSQGLIFEIKPVMDNLIGQAKFRIASSLYLEVLRLAGEENYL
jgi:predicted nucleic acid-binding protein